MILLDNEPVAVPKFISAKKLLEDKFILEISNDDKKNKKTRRIIELNLGDIACFVKPHSDFVCDTIVRGILPKPHNGLDKILDRALERIIVKRVLTIYQLAHFLIIDLEKDITKKYKSNY